VELACHLMRGHRVWLVIVVVGIGTLVALLRAAKAGPGQLTISSDKWPAVPRAPEAPTA
jgi:hypothetical protein